MGGSGPPSQNKFTAGDWTAAKRPRMGARSDISLISRGDPPGGDDVREIPLSLRAA